MHGGFWTILSRPAGDALHEGFAVLHDVLEKGLDEELPVHQLAPFGTRGRPRCGEFDEGDLQPGRGPARIKPMKSGCSVVSPPRNLNWTHTGRRRQTSSK